MLQVHLFLLENIWIYFAQNIVYAVNEIIFHKVSIVIWLGAGLSCNSHIKRISVLQSFSISRTETYPCSINANSITFIRVSLSYLLRPVLLSLTARYFLGRYDEKLHWMYIPDQKFLVIVLTDMVYYVFVGYICFSQLNYTTKNDCKHLLSEFLQSSFLVCFFTAPYCFKS